MTAPGSAGFDSRIRNMNLVNESFLLLYSASILVEF